MEHEQIETTVPKAKELRRHADRLITLAKKNTLASKRAAIAKLMVSYNTLTSKEMRSAKKEIPLLITAIGKLWVSSLTNSVAVMQLAMEGILASCAPQTVREIALLSVLLNTFNKGQSISNCPLPFYLVSSKEKFI